MRADEAAEQQTGRHERVPAGATDEHPGRAERADTEGEDHPAVLADARRPEQQCGPEEDQERVAAMVGIGKRDAERRYSRKHPMNASHENTRNVANLLLLVTTSTRPVM